MGSVSTRTNCGTPPRRPRRRPKPPPARAKDATTAGRTRDGTYRRGRGTATDVRKEIDVPDALEGEAYVGEEKVKIGTTLPVHLKGQVDSAVRFAQDTGGIDGTESITDFIGRMVPSTRVWCRSWG